MSGHFRVLRRPTVADLAATLIIVIALAAWFALLASTTPAEQRDCPAVTPPAAVPGPPVVAGR